LTEAVAQRGQGMNGLRIEPDGHDGGLRIGVTGRVLGGKVS
jgi:hypothetical protein